ncbi:MAG: hypothetical protein ABGW78_10475 [Pirellulales bacterium]
MNNLQLDLLFYNILVRIRSEDQEILQRVESDFSYFVNDNQDLQATAYLDILALRRPVDYANLPPLKATVYTPRNICFSKDDTTYIDYFGKALSIYDRKGNSLEIYCEGLNLLHEIIYLSILSRVSEGLEKHRMHRVHALAVQSEGEAALFMMPSGCGKTTLALQILQQDTPYRLISEDSPLINAEGEVLPFPLRFGVLGHPPESIPQEHITYFERMEFEPKYLISLKAFGDSISKGPTLPRFLFIGDRLLNGKCRIQEVGYFAGFKGLLRHMIVGIGLYQGLEFLLRSSVLDLWRMTGICWSRVRRAHTLLRQSRIFTLELGRDPLKNTEEILCFLETERFGHANTVVSKSNGAG